MIIIKKNIIFSLLFILGILFSLSIIGIKLIADKEDTGILIYLDPGHGGFDGGCSSNDSIYIEKNITLKISLLLANYLRSSGYIVKLTRDKDMALAHTKKEDMYKRVNLINSSKACLYLSIHANSYPSKNVRGAQIFYKSSQTSSKELARILTDKIHLIDKDNKRSALAIKNKYLVDNIDITGCLIEVGFLTNDIDLNNLISENYLSDFVVSLYLGITEYLDYLK